MERLKKHIDKFKGLDKKTQKQKICKVGYIASYINFGLLVVRYIYCIIFLDRKIISNNILYLLPAAAIPIATWIYSTDLKEYEYTQKKMLNIRLFLINALLVFLQPVYSGCWMLIVPRMMNSKLLRVNEIMTKEMLLFLIRIAVFAAPIIISILIISFVHSTVFNEEGIDKISKFKLKHIIDERENIDSKYDCKAVKDLETGKPIVVYENDRYTHTLVNGATGTGKTSSTLLVMINDDLEKKKENKECREREFLKMVKAGHATVRGPVREFNDKNIIPKKGYEKEYEAIRERWPDAGVTVMAPDPDTTDSVIKIARAKGMRVNVIDPEPDPKTGKPKKGLIGMNPFYVPLNLDEDDEIIWINDRAQYFYDIMSAMNASKGTGGGDPYFESVNNAVSVNIAKLVMKGVLIKYRRTPNIMDVSACINDFTKLKPYIEAIEKHYDIMVKKTELPQSQRAKKSQKVTAEALAESNVQATSKEEQSENDRKEIQSLNNPYFTAISYAKNRFLGESAEKWDEQAGGFRNLLNNFLSNPRITKLLTQKKFIDFNEILKNGEITVINTSLTMGMESSTAFGMFFFLNMKQAVLSRPEATRIPHWWYIDEFALYLSSAVEQAFTLFRKYKCGMVCAIQTLEQMEKSNTTKYLKGVITNSCSTQIVFGRVNLSEMELYEKLAGKEEILLPQKTVMSTSILDPNTRQSDSERVTPTMVNVMEGRTIRNKDFQQVTMFTVMEGRVLNPKEGTTDFLDYKYYKPQEVRHYNFEPYITEMDISEVYTEEDVKADNKDAELSDTIQRNVSHGVKIVDRTRETWNAANYASSEALGAIQMDSDDEVVNLIGYVSEGDKKATESHKNGEDEKINIFMGEKDEEDEDEELERMLNSYAKKI